MLRPRRHRALGGLEILFGGDRPDRIPVAVGQVEHLDRNVLPRGGAAFTRLSLVDSGERAGVDDRPVQVPIELTVGCWVGEIEGVDVMVLETVQPMRLRVLTDRAAQLASSNW